MQVILLTLLLQWKDIEDALMLVLIIKNMKNINIAALSVNELTTLMNECEARIKTITNSKIVNNEPKLIAAIKNLLSCVGKGYIPEDYYAKERYYPCNEDGTKIEGIKNIRIYHNIDNETFIKVKVTSPAGMLIPNAVEIDKKLYPITFVYSDNYCATIDY